MNRFYNLLLFILISSILFTLNACIPDEASCVDLIKNGDEEEIDCGGSCTPCVTCTDFIQNQDETDIDCGGLLCPPCLLINSSWQSVGEFIGDFVQSDSFKIDTIDLSFYLSTFKMEQYEQGTDSSRVFEGKYVQGEFNNEELWSISISQIVTDSSQMDTIITSGIFEMTMDNSSLTLEIIQTKPDIGNTPALPETGFGSTNGGNNDFYYRQIFTQL